MARQLVHPPVTERPPRMTHEEIVAWADEDTRAEWVDGEVIERATVKGRHTLVFGFFFELVRSFVRARRLGLVLSEPFEMLILDGRAARFPDIYVVLYEHLDRDSDEHLEGPEDLVIETVSDGSVREDRKVKRDEYAAAGIPEYWIVEGRKDRSGVVLLARSTDGRYEPVQPDAEGRLFSTVLPAFGSAPPGWRPIRCRTRSGR